MSHLPNAGDVDMTSQLADVTLVINVADVTGDVPIGIVP